MILFVIAGVLLAASGVPGLLLPWRSVWGPRVATLGVLLAAGLGIAGCAAVLSGAPPVVVALTSGAATASGIRLAIGVDALSAFFALPIFVVGALGSVYGLAYWPAAEHPRNGRRLRFCYGLLLASMLLVTLARDGASFLIAWEVMALCGYFLVTTESKSREVRQAGWLYLVYSHAGTLAIAGFFAVLTQASGDFALRALAPGEIGRDFAFAAFALALFGFGIKAGAMPLHSWLPSAHASAPSHVSAVMSGVVIKMGIYGLVRTTGLFDDLPLAWGVTVLALGAVAAFFGVVFALSQHDLKRLLAYHSIENIGIILLGLGLAMAGRSLGRPDWVVLGMAGCLLHVWNHALFKSLLFFGAGSLVHATGSRDLERMGGLARRMPATAMLFGIGALAICGLPPFNGFVSELLVYLGLARAAMAPMAPMAPLAPLSAGAAAISPAATGAWVALAAPVLAATGALAVACFVKVVGIVFLGTPRSVAAGEAHESPQAMLGPMAVLAAFCALLGVAPGMVAPALERAAAVWAGAPLAGPTLAVLAPLGWVSAGALALVALAGLLLFALLPVCRRGRLRQPALPTWDCGFGAGASGGVGARSTARLQYSASSFADLVTSRFAWALRPQERRPVIDRLFPVQAGFDSHVGDTVLELFVRPRVERLRQVAARIRAYQQGDLQKYVMYIVGAIVVLLLFNLRLDWLAGQLFGR